MYVKAWRFVFKVYFKDVIQFQNPLMHHDVKLLQMKIVYVLYRNTKSHIRSNSHKQALKAGWNLAKSLLKQDGNSLLSF